MKIFTIAFFLSLSVNLFSQDQIIGRYRDHFGSFIQLNADSTFKYTWSFDLGSSWTKGKWTIKQDTIYLYTVLIYDTLIYITDNNQKVDTLILSVFETPKRITMEQAVESMLSGGGQNIRAHPDILVFKNECLYEVKNGKLVTEKQNDFWLKGKWDPWYFKIED